MLSATKSRLSHWLLLSAMTAGLVACGKKDEPAENSKAATAKTGDMVTLTKAGAKIDPPAKKAQIPDGAWICDMGTVHWAASEKGDGTCPLCGMGLVQKGAKPEPAAEPSPDEAGKPATADQPAGGDATATPSIDGGAANDHGEHDGHAH